jgi:uncharacterized secreted repeat protein (TIGR03808 family)
MLNRRGLLGLAGAVPFAVLSRSGTAAEKLLPGMERASMRGSIDAARFGVYPGALDDQSRAFQRMLDRASEADQPVFLPAGAYRVSNIILPERVRLSGVSGATRLIYGGDGHLMAAEQSERVELSSLVFDGANRWLAEHAQGLLALRGIDHVVLDDCAVIGSSQHAVMLERCGGRIERSLLAGAADAGLYAVQSTGLRIAGNTVRDCGNGGILVHRWQAGHDGTTILGNRVERIAARRGGTGQFGNGINLFRTDHVIVTDNLVSDCAFSAIRANSASHIQLRGNTCLGSGETAIYAEFAFEGAVISGNIVDGAANGISVVNFNEGGRLAVCSGNIVRRLRRSGPYPADPPGFGVGITAEADSTITGNVVEDAPLYGIHIGWGPFMRNVTATGNVVRRAGTGIAVSVVEGTGMAVIADNVFDAVPSGAIVGHRWGEAATGDLARMPDQPFPHLVIGRNQVS